MSWLVSALTSSNERFNCLSKMLSILFNAANSMVWIALTLTALHNATQHLKRPIQQRWQSFNIFMLGTKCLLGLAVIVGILELMVVVSHPLFENFYSVPDTKDGLSIIGKAVGVLVEYVLNIRAGWLVVSFYYKLSILRFYRELIGPVAEDMLEVPIPEEPMVEERVPTEIAPVEIVPEDTPSVRVVATFERYEPPATRSRLRAQRVVERRAASL